MFKYQLCGAGVNTLGYGLQYFKCVPFRSWQSMNKLCKVFCEMVSFIHTSVLVIRQSEQL